MTREADGAGTALALSEYIAAGASARLPADVVDHALLHILDTVGAGVSGSVLGPGERGRAYVRRQRAEPCAAVWGSDARTSVPFAALANAMAAHADETDDSNAYSLTHPGCSTVPAAMAVAEAQGCPGMDFVRAVVVGYDVCCRVPPALWSDLFSPGCDRVYSTHAVGGVFGSAAAAACLLGFAPREVRSVLSYATQQASGIRSFFREGTHVEKAFVFAGMPAHHGTMAAELVEAGWAGADDPFSGEPNLFQLAAAPDPPALVDGLGERHEIVRTKFKKYAVGSPAQAPVEALLTALREGDLASEAVERVEVHLAAMRLRTVTDRPMPDVNIHYLLEVALTDGALSFAAAHDHDRFAAWQRRGPDPRIAVRADPGLGVSHGARVVVAATDGRTFSREVAAAPGSPENPMTRDDVEAKALDLMGPVLGAERARGLVARLRDLPMIGDVRELRPWLSGQAP